eukprot:Colp12_sorted_trinity150504_noHs@19097
MASFLNTTCPVISDLTYVKTPNGENIIIGKQPEGKNRVLVVEFWATWCPPCRDSIPHLSDLQRQYKDKEVYFIGVTDEEDEVKVKKFVTAQGSKMEYHVAIDSNHSANAGLFRPSGSRGIPTSFIVNHQNKVIYVGHPMEPAFASKLAEAAAQASPRHTPKALPLITETYEELMKKSVKELKAILEDRKIDYKGCTEKGDLAKLIEDRCKTVTYYK